MRLPFITACLLLVSMTYAQPTTKVVFKGQVVDAAENALPYATVAIFNQDSSLIDGTTAGEDGGFEVKVKPGIYDVRISMISYADTVFRQLELSGQTLDMGTVKLQPGSTDLQEVQVSGERSQMQLKLDKRVFDVGKDITSTGSNASEILDNLPSVTVDVEGNISLRGSGNVMILINGKPSSMVQSGDPQSLRQLQGSMIERIEVITNPSARYDAEGEVGMINIVLKKEDKGGVNGSVDVTTGWPHDHGAAFNINYRKNWINLFLSEGISWDRNPGSGYSIQRYDLSDTSFSFTRNRDMQREDFSNNLRMGADIYFNDDDVLTLSGTYEYSKGSRNNTTIYQDLDKNDEVLQNVTRTQDEGELEHEIEVNGMFEKNFDKEDHKLNIDFRYSLDDDTEDADYLEYSDQPGDEGIVQRSYNTEDQKRLQIQADYVYPFGNEGNLEAGTKASLRNINNDFKVEERSNGDWITLPEFDNNFLYTENIYSAYTMIGEKFGKISLQGGLRAEFTGITTELIKTNDLNERDYFNLFPSVFAGYEINKLNTIQASYSRRISRPRFWSLLPFRNYSDSRVIFAGNPDLNPEFTNSFELGYMKYLEFGSILSSVYYRHRVGVIERINTVDSTGLTRILPLNMAEEDNFGLEFNMNLNITKWWRANGNFNFYRAITSGEHEGNDLFRDTYTWRARLSTKATIAQTVDVQLSARYRAPTETTQGTREAITVMDFGASMDVLKGNGTITLNVRDLLNSRMYKGEIIEGNFYSYTEFQWRTRQLQLSFNYRINQNKQQRRPGQQPDFEGEGM